MIKTIKEYYDIISDKYPELMGCLIAYIGFIVVGIYIFVKVLTID